MNAIETIGLTKDYGKARGIIDLNLKVEAGDIFGFIGPNGAGKSTTIRLLLGLISSTRGVAKVFGMDCEKEHKNVLQQIGYMPSEAQFYPQLTVAQVIKLAAALHKKDCSKVAMEMCDRFQLDSKKKVEDLSLGNRKKVSLVCALQHEPKLCILDEPTSGLDPLMQKEFFNLLEERNKKGATIFFSSHVLPEIQNHCRNAAVIREGKLIRQSSVEELSSSSAKRVSIIGTNQFEIQGMADVKVEKGEIQFLYNGDIKKLIEKVNQCEFQDISITEPSLDEIFMHYYE